MHSSDNTHSGATSKVGGVVTFGPMSPLPGNTLLVNVKRLRSHTAEPFAVPINKGLNGPKGVLCILFASLLRFKADASV